MYEAYWQLQSRPFENCADAAFYYPSEVHQGALLKLRYAVENRRGAALLAGAAGVGKTLLVGALGRQLGEAYAPKAHIVFPQMSPGELLNYLAAELGALSSPTAVVRIDESIRRLQQFLAENTEQGKHAVVAIDEAQMLLETEALETLRLLLNFESNGQPVLTLLLSGQPELLPALERLPGLEARLGVKCLLRPFTLDETCSYVNHRMKAAGASREIFTNEALQTLFHLTGGNPRRINRLCDLALLIGYAEEQVRINAPHIESVCNELVTVTPE
ncbi:MAG: AAA family ATPase [Planctomycetota bacterium]|nr:MAG: AAA family ATPase [Planctomycetota bacterium]